MRETIIRCDVCGNKTVTAKNPQFSSKMLNLNPVMRDREISFRYTSEAFDKPLDLCPNCADKISDLLYDLSTHHI